VPDRHVLAFDLGTGGCKAALWSADGTCVAETFAAYPTAHPAPGLAEQRPQDWWDAVVGSTRRLLDAAAPDPATIAALALSGQSLGVVPVDDDGALLLDATPIWSDTRGGPQAASVFRSIAEEDWYGRTGNGFPAGLYTAFKIMWLREHRPDVLARTRVVLGSKDWINLRLTGAVATDHSYASGSGVYDLAAGDYDDELLAATGLDRSLLPPIVAATDVVGALTDGAARELGLRAGTPVLAGGVDNSCMAIGARNLAEGELYGSLGSSSWLTVTSAQPVLDPVIRPFVFASVAPGLFHSAVSTFGSGTSLAWLAETLLADAAAREPARLMELAGASVPGARGLLFLPTLSGGTVLEGGPDARGAFVGLDLAHTPADLVRACLEGIAFALGRALDALRGLTTIGDEVLVVGGGSKSALWRQIYADVFGMPVVKTTIDQQAASLGAAAVALVGVGLWDSFDRVRDLHEVEARHAPDAATAAVLHPLREVFTDAAAAQAAYAPVLAAVRGS
jgi:xylulokinase